jgi:hypothetical protein
MLSGAQHNRVPYAGVIGVPGRRLRVTCWSAPPFLLIGTSSASSIGPRERTRESFSVSEPRVRPARRKIPLAGRAITPDRRILRAEHPPISAASEIRIGAEMALQICFGVQPVGMSARLA